MARRRYRRYRKRSGKWSPNIKRIGPSSFNIPAQTRDGTTITLIENQPYDETRGNNVLRTKNIEVSMEFETPTTNGANRENAYIESCTYYILFVPEGYNVTIDTPIQHPEWIMAYKYTGSPISEFYPQLASVALMSNNKYIEKIRTRLSSI